MSFYIILETFRAPVGESATVVEDDFVQAAAGVRVRVNNSDDIEHDPETRRRIVRFARMRVGEIVRYSTSGNPVYTLVRHCRYGRHQAWINEEKTKWRWVMKVSSWQTPEELQEHAKPGDIIQMQYALCTHAGIFIGKIKGVHMIVHSTGSPGQLLKDGDVSRVKEEPFAEVMKGVEVRVNNSDDIEHTPLSTAKIVKRARNRVGELYKFDLLYHNCENFATQCRYGSETGWTIQGERITDVLEKPIELVDSIRDTVEDIVD
uniref:Uncharacterized protein LOC102808682 n=1 Tax=Saccoglossus kowalevskii TaxID=10224 RepID=A0ABM0MQX0_SACKO|nr:PREDICTED: uncharacterized protein LOC102808682 [Saccoglossus kowalevskii]